MTRDALALWKEYLEMAHRMDNSIQARLLTDLTGNGYCIILELTYEAYADLEPRKCKLTQLTGWPEFYRQFIPLCEGSERTLYKLEQAF
jgi:hypothetical protein